MKIKNILYYIISSVWLQYLFIGSKFWFKIHFIQNQVITWNRFCIEMFSTPTPQSPFFGSTAQSQRFIYESWNFIWDNIARCTLNNPIHLPCLSSHRTTRTFSPHLHNISIPWFNIAPFVRLAILQFTSAIWSSSIYSIIEVLLTFFETGVK